MPQPTNTTPQLDTHKNIHNAIHDVKGMYGAAGDGVTDDTAAFNNAVTGAGTGGSIFVPTGTYILNDWTPSQTVHVRGAGMPSNGGVGGTILKAKAGATWVVKFVGLYHPTLSNLGIDGNTRAASGVLIQGSGGTAQGSRIDNVYFHRCDIGVKYDASALQADKNSLSRVRIDESLTGVWLLGSNSQYADLQEVTIGANIGVRMSGGTLVWTSGGCTHSTAGSCQGILIDNAAVYSVTLTDWIDEYLVPAVSIDGTTAWPVLGVTLNHCVVTGSTATVKLGTNSGHLYARQTQFSIGNVIAVANDTLFVEENCTYTGGAAWSQTGSSNRRIQTTINGTFYYFNNMSTPLASHYVTGEVRTKGVSTLVKAGVPTDADFIFEEDGMFAVDSTNNRIYVRIGGVWKYAAVI